MSAYPGLAVAAALVGAVTASFALTSALRVSAGRPWATGRSACDHCGVALSYAQTAPIAAFVAQGGRCRACGGPIALIHLGGEIAGAATGVLVVSILPVAQWAIGSGLALVLVFVAAFDLRTLRIPNAAVLLVAGLGAMASALRGDVVESAWGALVILVVLGGLASLYRRARGRTGLGLGDVKLAAALSLWAGPLLSPIALSGACVLALAWAATRRSTDVRIPFAPFLSVGFWSAGLVGSGS